MIVHLDSNVLFGQKQECKIMYHYNIKGENKGPITLEELHSLYEGDIISLDTPVLVAGTTQWHRYRQFTELDTQNIKNANLLMQVSTINEKVDAFLQRILRLPIPQTSEGQMGLLSLLSASFALVIFLSCTVMGFYVGFSMGGSDIIGFGLLGILIGFILQYVYFHLYSLNSSLLLSQKIVLASQSFPKILAVISILGLALSCITFVMACKSAFIVAIVPALLTVLFSLMMTALSVNADKIFVTIRTDSIAPGRELCNIIRFFIKISMLSLHVLLPIIFPLAVLTVFQQLNTSNISALSFMQSLTSSYFLLGPVVIFAVLSGTSFVLDLCESIFSLTDKPKDK